MVDPKEVARVWKPYLEKKNPGFAWDGSDYERPSRNQSADKEGLLQYRKPLQDLLGLAPTGFPTHSSMRESFELTDSQYDILPKSAVGRRHTAGKAADVWRKMCADLYRMRKDGVYDPSLEDLVSCIVIQRASTVSSAATSAKSEASSSGGTASTEVPPSPITSAPAGEMSMPNFPDFSDVESQVLVSDDEGTCDDVGICYDEVEIVHIRCQCPDCQVPVPEAAIGGQKRATMALPAAIAATSSWIPTHRLRAKTTLQAPTSAPSKKAKKQIPRSRLKLRAVDRCIVKPVKIVKRAGTRKKGAENYIIDQSTKHSYIVGCSFKAHVNYGHIISKVAELIEAGKLTRVSEAKEFVHRYVSKQAEWST